MDIELHDCPYCETEGVLLMTDGRCPNCKRILNNENVKGAEASDFEGKRKRRHRALRIRKFFFWSVIFIITGIIVNFTHNDSSLLGSLIHWSTVGMPVAIVISILFGFPDESK